MTLVKSRMLLLLFLVAVSAHAQSTADARQAPSSAIATSEMPELPETADAANGATVGKDEGKQVCRRETVTGSRFTQRICMSEADWAELRRATKAALRDAESRPQNPYREDGS